MSINNPGWNMGDSEIKIEYTPEELAEIERIKGVLEEETARPPVTASGMVRSAAVQSIVSSSDEEGDIDLSEDAFKDGDDEFGAFDEDAVSSKSESLDDIGDDVIDVPEADDEPEPIDITSDIELMDESESENPPDFDYDAVLPDEPDAGGGDTAEYIDDQSTLGQLKSLTMSEPESIDAQDIAESDEYFDETPSTRVTAPASASGAPEEKEDAASFDDAAVSGDDSADAGVELGGGEIEAPELEGLSLEDSSSIPEGNISEIPDFDLDSVSPSGGDEESIPELPEESIQTADDDDLLSLEGMDDLGAAPVTDSKNKKTPEKKPAPADAGDKLNFDSIEEDFGEDIKAAEAEDNFEIEPLDDEFDSPPPKKKAEKAPEKKAKQIQPDVGEPETMELSERDLKKLKKAILLFSHGLRHAVKDTVIHDRIPEEDIRALVDMIISGKSESSVKSFLEQQLGEDISDEAEAPARRIITSRPEYTREGLERQKRLMKRTMIFGASALAAFLVTILSYQFIYKPVMAKRTIKEGVALILSSKKEFPDQKAANLKKAEELFKYVDENYAKDYLYGYNSYARAYFSIKKYDESIQKLNGAFKINPHDIESLNNLGYFYSRVPDQNFSMLKPYVMKWYYKDPDKKAQKSKLEISIDFYTRVLIKDKKNITALYGIGNAYYYNGEFLKAKKYYEDILKVDPDSVVGYSGLLNFYIERDVFEQVVQIHSDLRDKKMLHEVPSALLAKTAMYYIDKFSPTGMNPRIDYGVQSPKFIDANDKIYPAVKSILSALNKRDNNYPPLQLCYARVAQLEQNLEGMKRHLDKAVSLEKNYFAAHNMLGEFYYQMNEPVRAYDSLKRAMNAHDNPPEFTEEDFYKETETLGKTHFILGNIFYYFYDRGRMNQGSFENEIIEEEAEKKNNFETAAKEYEYALKENFDSPELRYNLGRIYYMNKEWEKCLEQWICLYDVFADAPELMLSLGNAFYQNGNKDAAKGEYLKLIASYEYEADKIKAPRAADNNHYKIFMALSTANNNLAAVYQYMKDETKSTVTYWKSIEYAQRLGYENEYARVNINRAFKGDRREEGILDESIAYSIKYFKEDMRKK